MATGLLLLLDALVLDRRGPVADDLVDIALVLTNELLELVPEGETAIAAVHDHILEQPALLVVIVHRVGHRILVTGFGNDLEIDRGAVLGARVDLGTEHVDVELVRLDEGLAIGIEQTLLEDFDEAGLLILACLT